MMNKERERENAERNKKEKEGETLDVLSLFFFLPVVSFFANTRDDREQSRTFYVSFFLFCVVVVVVVVVVVFHVARGKKVLTKKFQPFFIRSRVFFFPTLIFSPYSPFHCAVLLREYRVRRTRNRLI